MKQQKCWCSFLSHKLLAVLMSVAILAVMLTGFLTGVSVYMGGRVDGVSPPAPTSSGSPHSASIFPDND
ncbi:hypothetical protein BDA96_03G102600 [Sorghum bicolor]|uniref:Uncharacterized protein n=2 Tax=Sorghum bicolor TaxID=4558 RepID=A0A1B6Q2F0_SORBI|nr:hypothetical protein BDA96_03G102600 [Sorghum bicolor]KXG32080.1 hypothetical protein SORBI_3003G097300 [Sorghum bicolor]